MRNSNKMNRIHNSTLMRDDNNFYRINKKI